LEANAMNMLDFTLILPVLTCQNITAGEMDEIIQGEYQPLGESLTPEYVPAILAEINSIPDGIHLVNFPGHYDTSDCWCRPTVVAIEGLILVNHKDLNRGEFDS
jgi:hypothetical protein